MLKVTIGGARRDWPRRRPPDPKHRLRYMATEGRFAETEYFTRSMCSEPTDDAGNGFVSHDDGFCDESSECAGTLSSAVNQIATCLPSDASLSTQVMQDAQIDNQMMLFLAQLRQQVFQQLQSMQARQMTTTVTDGDVRMPPTVLKVPRPCYPPTTHGHSLGRWA